MRRIVVVVAGGRVINNQLASRLDWGRGIIFQPMLKIGGNGCWFVYYFQGGLSPVPSSL